MKLGQIMKRWLYTALLAISIPIFSACSSGGGSTIGVSLTDLSGTWSGSMSSTNKLTNHLFTILITQTEAGSFSGIADFSVILNGDCFLGGKITGTIEGTAVTITISDGGTSTITFNGTLSGSVIAGLYSSTSPTTNPGSDICNGVDTGRWSMLYGG